MLDLKFYLSVQQNVWDEGKSVFEPWRENSPPAALLWGLPLLGHPTLGCAERRNQALVQRTVLFLGLTPWSALACQ